MTWRYLADCNNTTGKSIDSDLKLLLMNVYQLIQVGHSCFKMYTHQLNSYDSYIYRFDLSKEKIGLFNAPQYVAKPKVYPSFSVPDVYYRAPETAILVGTLIYR